MGHRGLSAQISGQPAGARGLLWAAQQVFFCEAKALAWGHLLEGNYDLWPSMTHTKSSQGHSCGLQDVASLIIRPAILVAFSRHAFEQF